MTLPVKQAATSPWLRRLLGVLCVALLLAMMVLTVADVLGRYLLAAPVPGATELTEMLLATVVFIGIPAACFDREHVTVDLVTEALRASLRRSLDRVVSALSGGVLAVIAWRIWVIGDQIASYHGTTPTLKLPFAPLAYMPGTLCAGAALIMMALALLPKEKHNG